MHRNKFTGVLSASKYVTKLLGDFYILQPFVIYMNENMSVLNGSQTFRTMTFS